MKFILIAIAFIFSVNPNFAQPIAKAGNDAAFCVGNFIQLGGSPVASGGSGGYTFSWIPATTLNNPSVAKPLATPTSTTTYTLTVFDSNGDSAKDFATITVYPLPNLDAGNDTTIFQGERATLHASGAQTYLWSPPNTLRYENTFNPDAEPNATTTYYVIGTSEFGCTAIDSVTVFIEKSTALVFYNTFTPNGDGENDTWYIGNLSKYPDCKMEIYNRYGNLVYSKSPYDNDWDGETFDGRLPDATYYYIFYPGNGDKKIKGSITIVR